MTVLLDSCAVPANVQELLDLAAIDYDAFWLNLDQKDRELTADLTVEEDYDAAFILDDEVWMLSYNEVTEEFQAEPIGFTKDLVVYANQELTGIDDDEALDAFIEILQAQFSVVEVRKGQASSGKSGAEWLTSLWTVERKWEAAMQELGE